MFFFRTSFQMLQGKCDLPDRQVTFPPQHFTPLLMTADVGGSFCISSFCTSSVPQGRAWRDVSSCWSFRLDFVDKLVKITQLFLLLHDLVFQLVQSPLLVSATLWPCLYGIFFFCRNFVCLPKFVIEFSDEKSQNVMLFYCKKLP